MLTRLYHLSKSHANRQTSKYPINTTTFNYQFKAEPLVPIGCITTAYFLGSGIKSFYNRDPAKSQTMMRLRVGSQFATILIFIGYAGWNSFTFDFAPGMASPSDQFPGATAGGGKDGGKGGDGEQ